MNRLYTLLTVMVAMLGAALFITAHESSAQGLTGCQNAQGVLEHGPVTGNSTTDTFRTTTSGFRVNYEGSSFDPAPPGSTAVISILNEASQPVPGAPERRVDANTDTSVFFDLPPGTYRVDINLDNQTAEGKSYRVSVDQCRETTPTPTGDIASCQNAQGVLEHGPVTGNSTTDTFRTTTSGFRVNYEGSSFDPAPPGSTAVISILNEASQPVPGAPERRVDANTDTSVFFDLPPGTYRVDINLDNQTAEGKSYRVSVDQCRETTPTPTDESASCQSARQVLVPDTFIGDITDPLEFRTTTNASRVNYDAINPAQNSNIAIISIRQNVSGQVVGTRTINAREDNSVFFNLPPDTYGLEVDIDPESTESETTYRVSVDECRETTPTPTDESASCQS